MLRGTAGGLEFVFGSEAFEDVAAALRGRLGERPDFYRGSAASLIFHGALPADDALSEFLEAVRGNGVEVRGLYGDAASEAVAGRHALAYLGIPAKPAARVSSIAQRRAQAAPSLTEGARALDADFAGGRADLAARRVRRTVRASTAYARPQAVPVDAVATRYYRGTLRGGQSLQQVGNIVVVGDVNPGAELVATGDIV